MYYFLNILDFSILFEIKMHIPDLFHKFLYYFPPVHGDRCHMPE